MFLLVAFVWLAQIVAWTLGLFIWGNAIAQYASDGQILGVVLAAVLGPITTVVYPFIAPENHLAWPLADGTSFIPFLIITLVCAAISSFFSD